VGLARVTGLLHVVLAARGPWATCSYLGRGFKFMAEIILCMSVVGEYCLSRRVGDRLAASGLGVVCEMFSWLLGGNCMRWGLNFPLNSTSL